LAKIAAVSPKPAVVVDLAWSGDLRFSVTFPSATSNGAPLASLPLVFDSAGKAGPSPVGALAASLAACMSIDLAHILSRGRHTFKDIRTRLEADRAQEDPHRLLRVRLHFTIRGTVPTDAVERAIALSRDRYCSVWHSLREDIHLQVTFELSA
jgi:putative redox protein